MRTLIPTLTLTLLLAACETSDDPKLDAFVEDATPATTVGDIQERAATAICRFYLRCGDVERAAFDQCVIDVAFARCVERSCDDEFTGAEADVAACEAGMEDAPCSTTVAGGPTNPFACWGSL